jgi:hypothetical protein
MTPYTQQQGWQMVESMAGGSDGMPPGIPSRPTFHKRQATMNIPVHRNWNYSAGTNKDPAESWVFGESLVQLKFSISLTSPQENPGEEVHLTIPECLLE